MRLIAYGRVSTDEQASEGVSLAAQREQMIGYAKAYQHELLEFIEDPGISGATLERPGIKKVLKLVREGADGILITKLDRLSRSVLDILKLVDTKLKRKALVSVYEQLDVSTPQGRVMLTVMASFAQYEREVIAQRTRSALQHKKANGVKLGALPFGYRRIKGANGKVLQTVVDDAEQLVLARVLDLERLRMTLTQIAGTLTAEGLHTKRGGRWHLTTVRKLLARAHVGDARYDLITSA
jgi:site-specific DNA recombinase